MSVLLSEPTGSVTRWDDDFEYPLITVCPYYPLNRDTLQRFVCGYRKEIEAMYGNDTLLDVFKKEGLTLQKLLD